MPGGSHGHAVCNIEPISGKKSIQLASVHSLVTLTSGAFEPYAFDVGLAWFSHCEIHFDSGRAAAAYSQRDFTVVAKQLH